MILQRWRQTFNDPKTSNFILWILQIAAAFTFIFSAMGKLVGDLWYVQMFQALEWGEWSRLLVGIIELVGALLLLSAHWASIGAAILMVLLFFFFVIYRYLFGLDAWWVWPWMIIMIGICRGRWYRMLMEVRARRYLT